jgi:hypothetical protein
MRYLFVVLSMFLLNITFPAFAQQKDQRGGNCEQTKSQHEYFCTKKGDPAKDDIMTTANIACKNAKRNMQLLATALVKRMLPWACVHPSFCTTFRT